MSDEYIEIGMITNSHGVRGAVKVFHYSDYKERFEELKKLYLGDAKTELNIKKVFYHKNLVVLEFEEFNNINEILKYKNEYLYIKAEDKRELPEGNYYIRDLIGCEVYNLEDEHIGTISQVMSGIGNDVYVIKSENGEFMVPAVKQFIKSVDIEAKKIIIEPIKGLLE